MQAITGDSVVTKIERARSALIDSLRRLEEIVPQEIAYQVLLSIDVSFMYSYEYYMLNTVSHFIRDF